MLTSGLVRILGELPDQVLEDVAHVVRLKLVQVLHVGELANDLVQQLGLGKPGDLVVEVEPGQDGPDIR